MAKRTSDSISEIPRKITRNTGESSPISELATNPGLYNIFTQILQCLDFKSLLNVKISGQIFYNFIETYFKRQFLTFQLNEYGIIEFQKYEGISDNLKIVFAHYAKDSIESLENFVWHMKIYMHQTQFEDAIKEALNNGNEAFLDLFLISQQALEEIRKKYTAKYEINVINILIFGCKYRYYNSVKKYMGNFGRSHINQSFEGSVTGVTPLHLACRFKNLQMV